MNVIRNSRDMDSHDMSASRIAAVLLSVFLIPVAAPAQTYPTKPVRIVVAASPGGSPDIISRMMGPRLTEILGQPMVIDNRAGASGMIAVELAAKAAPDGYTVLMATSSQACVEVLTRNPRYQLGRDFAPISLVGTVTSVLLANPAVPATTVAQFVALAKSRPGALKHGSSGPGSSSHLPAELFKIRTGTSILHVPYKAASPALVGLMGGEIDVMFSPITSAMSLIKTGKLRALGVTSEAQCAGSTSRRSPKRSGFRIPALAVAHGAGENTARDSRETERRGEPDAGHALDTGGHEDHRQRTAWHLPARAHRVRK
jgi:tripartite-type tricarboxylate transporter receptor subunit TctC